MAQNAVKQQEDENQQARWLEKLAEKAHQANAEMPITGSGDQGWQQQKHDKHKKQREAAQSDESPTKLAAISSHQPSVVSWRRGVGSR
jgi:hypothetical protein